MNYFYQDIWEERFKKMEAYLEHIHEKMDLYEKSGDIESSHALHDLYRNTLQSVQHHQIWLDHHGS